METGTRNPALALSDEEAALLVDVLREALANLREEVYKTENYDWRQALKRRETLLNEILARLAAAGG